MFRNCSALSRTAAPDSALEILRASSRVDMRVYDSAFTQNLVVGQAPAQSPAPIKAWFPQDERTGRQFTY